MTDPSNRESPGKAPATPPFTDLAAAKADRKLRARRNAGREVWMGLGTMGLVGWSIAVPTLLGAALGIWLDGTHLSQRSWTLAFLIAGLVLGCAIAWHWVAKEERAMKDEREAGDA